MATPVTMADVARRAGVSTATVSRVLAGNRPVAPHYRELVERAADELGYRVNLVGRALRMQRTATVGLVVPDLGNPFFSAFASQLSRTFDGSGTDLLVFSSENRLDIEMRGVHSFAGRQVDALVIVPVHEVDSDEAITVAEGATVTIQLDRRVPGRAVHFVGCDNHYGLQLIRRHVDAAVDLQQRPLIYLGAEASSSSGHERRDAFRRSFADLGGCREYAGSFSFDWGQQAVDRVLADGVRAGTLVAAADVIALGAMARLHALGRRIPHDFRIIGFDGIGVAPYAHPSLTTVRQPIEEMGQAVYEIIERGSSAADEVIKQRLRPQLVVGDSSPE